MIDLKTVEHLARLSALEFSGDELKDMQVELESMTKFVDQILSVDVNDDLKYDNQASIEDLREDNAIIGLSQEEVLTNAPLAKKGAFAVPKMLD